MTFNCPMAMSSQWHISRWAFVIVVISVVGTSGARNLRDFGDKLSEDEVGRSRSVGLRLDVSPAFSVACTQSSSSCMLPPLVIIHITKRTCFRFFSKAPLPGCPFTMYRSQETPSFILPPAADMPKPSGSLSRDRR